MQGFHCFCTALSFPGKVPYSVRLRCKSAGDLRVFSCQALSLVGPPKISSRRKQRRRCFRWPQACTKEKESQGDRGINPVLTLVLCRESPFTLFGFCASHNARRCSEAWRLILCYVLGVSNTPILLYFLISSPYHLQRVAFPTVVKFLLDICALIQAADRDTKLEKLDKRRGGFCPILLPGQPGGLWGSP